MAKKGLLYACAGLFDDATGAVKADSGKYLGPTETLTGSINAGSSKDYGDSRLLEEDKTPTDGSLTWTLTDDDDEIYTFLLGHAKVADSGDNKDEIQFSQLDEAPYVSVAVYGRNGDKYTAKGYRKVQFSEAEDTEETKKDSLTFGHTTLNGTIYMGGSSDTKRIYKSRKTFATDAEALAWCKKYCGVPAEQATQADQTGKAAK